MDANEIEFNFQEWRAAYRLRFDTLKTRVFNALQSGETIIEVWANGKRSEWRAGAKDGDGAAGTTFLPQYRTPEYLTGHLMNRHEHFGLGMEFANGDTFEAAKLATKAVEYQAHVEGIIDRIASARRYTA